MVSGRVADSMVEIDLRLGKADVGAARCLSAPLLRFSQGEDDHVRALGEFHRLGDSGLVHVERVAGMLHDAEPSLGAIGLSQRVAKRDRFLADALPRPSS